MSDDMRRLTTDEQRARLYAARNSGGLCTACGRLLDDGEPVYIEYVAIDRKPLAAAGAQWRQTTAYRDVPLGAECASPGFLARMVGQGPERCEHCGRPVYYDAEREGRYRVACSKRCSTRARRAARGRP